MPSVGQVTGPLSLSGQSCRRDLALSQESRNFTWSQARGPGGS